MNFKSLLSVLALFLILDREPIVDGAKILAVLPYPSKSHFMMITPIVKGLIKNGHEITAVTAVSLETQNLGSNYTEIIVPVYDFWSDVMRIFKARSLFDLAEVSFFDYLNLTALIGIKTTEHALQQPKVQQLINLGSEESARRFDLLLTEQFYQEAVLAFAYKFNVPVVTICTMTHLNYLSQTMGLITPWSFVPHWFMPFDDQMNFFERLQNSAYSLMEDLYREYKYFPQMDDLVKRYFSHLSVKFPSVSQMEKNVSLILFNSYTPLFSPRPTVDTMVSVGGLHISAPKKLPDDIQRFMDEAKHGVIYFSLGSNVQSKDMPAEKLKVFLDVFSSLKQRVLWKFENESLPGLPKNVMVKKWMPQNDILAHAKVKVFITHGGLFGTQEGVYYGVPLLGFPVYCDQHVNMNKAVKSGYGLMLHLQSVTEDSLTNALLQLIENPQYKQNMKRVSQIFRDRPTSARNTAIYWIEYVIRHKGAKHLRSAGMNLKWYEFYLLDVIAFVAGILTFVILFFVLAIRFFLRAKPRAIKRKNE